MSTLYLIDDEPELVDLLSDVAELAGLTPHGFTRAEKFFEQVTTFDRGAILVLDLNMPQMDGIEVMRRLASMENPPSLVLISGHDSGVLHAAEKLGRAHNLEILASMAKPVKLAEFSQLLKQQGLHPSGEHFRSIEVEQRQLTANELHLAIQQSQLVLHFEPQVHIPTGTLNSVEALVRWQHPELGLIYPDRFISLAEEEGLMGELTHWVIGEVVRQEQEWQKEDFPVAISVNISAADITSLLLPEQLSELLTNNKLDPTRLTLEVTESALMGELVTSLDILTRLRLKGIGLSIDDFGTGYSSLSQLHRVPFTELKIDRSFVSNIAMDPEARAIVKTCIMLGHELNMQIVAEGVENQAIWEHLVEMECDLAQGYLFTRSMPGDALLAWGRERGLRSTHLLHRV